VHGVGGAVSVTVKVWPAIVSVPLRGAEVVFAAALKPTVPLPVPDPGDVNVSQSGLLDAAVHVQAAAVVIVTLPVPPVSDKDWLIGAIVKLHDASCVTVIVCPAIVNVPLRLAPVEFAAALKLTVAPPVPFAGLVIVIQFAFDAAVHAHPAVVEIVAEPDPPAGAIACVPGVTENAHGAASCETVTVRPATVTVADRAAPLFALTVNPTVPLPVPDDVSPEIFSQLALDDAFHEQSPRVVTVTEPVPPEAGIDWLDGASVKVHAAEGWDTVTVTPAIVSVPLRAAPLFAAALYVTCPVPLPEPLLVTVIHDAFDTAAQVHPDAALTPTCSVPPSAATDCDVASSV